MRRYETIVIIDPDITEEDRTTLLARTQEIIPQQDGVFIQEDHWGLKKMAYDIRKKPRGYYVLLDYCGTGKAVDELERFFRIDDRAMKYMTVQIDPDADADKILEEIAEAKRQKEEASQAAAASSEVPQEVTESSEAATETDSAESKPAEQPAEEASQSAEESKVNEPTPEN